MKFKVGDIVRGKEKSSSRYGITNENMYRGRIVKVADDDYIDIEILEHKDKEFIGKKYTYLNPEYFKLLREYTYEDLKKSPLGTKIVFEKGQRIYFRRIRFIGEKLMLETKCSTCLGCNRLEDKNFKEVYRCENYVRGREEDGREVTGDS